MSASENLTITITGPQGCGKTRGAQWIADNLPRAIRQPYEREAVRLSSVIIIDGEGPDQQETRL